MRHPNFLPRLLTTWVGVSITFCILASIGAAAEEPSSALALSVTLAPPAPLPVSAPKLEWSGDLRYRAARTKESVDDERPFQQLRARLGLKSDVNEQVKAIVRLATGTSAISTNQTLGDQKDPGMARRSFGIDLAYLDTKIGDAGSVWAGRTANPFFAPGKNQLLFDGDLAFEGLAFKWEPKWEGSSAFVNAGAFIISENYLSGTPPASDVPDTGILGVEAGWSVKAAGMWTVRFAAQHYINIEGMPITAIDKDAKTDPYSYPFDRFKGNQVYPNDPALPPDSRKYFMQTGFYLLLAGLEWKQKIGPADATLYLDVVRNQLTQDLDRAEEVGATVKWGAFTVGAAYAVKRTNAVVGAFTDSDMNGGGTDNRGTRLSLAYQLRKNAQLALNDFRAKRGIDSVERDFAGTQLDFLLAF